MRPFVSLCIFSIFLTLNGCWRDENKPQYSCIKIWGKKGHTAGRFNKPRGIEIDTVNKLIYVIDRDGRIQKFTTNGEFRGSWRMPDIELGKPEDLCVGPDGNIYIADTHYSRIMKFSPKGKILMVFGRYGKNKGEFIYPVAICADNKYLYVAEYGGNDRVQKFDLNGNFKLAWGKYGTGPGEFRRPSGIALGPNHTILVADAVNHRIQQFDTYGNFIREYGGLGTSLGKLRYPYDITLGPGGYIYVLEYGNQRVQKFSKDGKAISIWGGPGKGIGCLASPWCITGDNNAIYISDTGNNRIVKVRF